MVGRKFVGSSLTVAMLVATGIVATSAAAPAAPHSQKACTSDPGITDSEIKVGAIIPTSGPSASSFSASLDGIQARFAKANAEGEVGDRTLVLDVEDDGADPARNLSAAQQLIEQDDVFGVISVTTASDSSGAYFEQQGIPVTGWHLGNSAWGKYKNMFGWRNSNSPDPSLFTTRNADGIKKLGGTKVAIVGTSAASSATFVDQVEQAVEKTKGLKVVYKTADLTPADRDFTGIAAKIEEAGADAVYTGMDFLQNAALSQALAQAGITLNAIVFPGGYDARGLAIPGLEGVYFSVEFKPFELQAPAFKEYEKWMTQTAPDKPYLGQVPYVGWLSADVFIEGVKAAGVGCPTRKAFIKKLRKVKGYDANGAFEPVDFAKVFGKPTLCTYYVQVLDGAFVPQFDGEPLCPKALIDDGKLKKLTPAYLEGS